MEDGEMQLLAVKLFKYCIDLAPNPSEQPVFTDFLVSDLVNTAKIHATHRFLIQGRQSQRIYALVSSALSFESAMLMRYTLDMVV